MFSLLLPLFTLSNWINWNLCSWLSGSYLICLLFIESFLLQMHKFQPIWVVLISLCLSQSFTLRLKLSLRPLLIPINSEQRHCLSLLRFTADPGAAAAAYFPAKSSAHKKHLISSPPAFFCLFIWMNTGGWDCSCILWVMQNDLVSLLLLTLHVFFFSTWRVWFQKLFSFSKNVTRAFCGTLSLKLAN